eukprot:5307056-Pleurochrysis_carterae.AAC.1
MPTLKHGYWNIRGLAAPSRMMAAYAGVEMEDVQYDIVVKPEGGFDGSAWFAKDKPALAEKNPMVNLPYVHDTENDLVVTQSTAVRKDPPAPSARDSSTIKPRTFARSDHPPCSSAQLTFRSQDSGPHVLSRLPP